MKPSAVLLIDLENFYCSREDHCRDGPSPGYDRARFADDLERLLGYARAMAGGLPFTVRRAYANFNAARYAGGPPQYYLRHAPDELMRQGVEPVQVFRLSQGTGKNAADMRMAMDAAALLNGVGSVEHFVLVTGDADFIPVVLELKRHGHAVSVIGVTGATSALMQRFVDNFELFEDLLAADEVESGGGALASPSEAFWRVAAALRKLLARSHPLRFSAVKPLLSKELGHAFDPGAFGCDTTGEFLRKYQGELGLSIRALPHDQVIDLPVSSPPAAAGSKIVVTAPPKPPPAPDEIHTAAGYLKLLKGGGAKGSPTETIKVLPVPWPSVQRVCADIFPLLGEECGGGPMAREQLWDSLTEAGKELGAERYDQHVRRTLGILRVSGDLVEQPEGVALSIDVASAPDLRKRTLTFLLQLLRLRLEERGVSDPIRPEAFAAALEAGPLARALAEEVAPAVEWLYREPAPDDAEVQLELAEPPVGTPADSGVLSVSGGAPVGAAEPGGPALSNSEPGWPHGARGEESGSKSQANPAALSPVVPVADWIPDGEPLPPPEESLFPFSSPAPLPGATPRPVSKITSPPLSASAPPPPKPPLPPESA